MAVMLTLNLKKPDSSQFISEIQYEKDWAAARDRKPRDYFYYNLLTGSFSQILVSGDKTLSCRNLVRKLTKKIRST